MNNDNREFIYINKVIYVRCITDKYANFEKDKIYRATAYAKCMGGTYTSFKIEDEDRELFTIRVKDLGKKFILVNEEEIRDGLFV